MFEIQSSELALQRIATPGPRFGDDQGITLRSLVTSGKANVKPPTTLHVDHQRKLDERRGLKGKQSNETYERAQLRGAQNGDNEDR
jgi:hypothetical protein